MRPEFQWTAAANADSYHLLVLPVAGGPPVLNETGIVGTSFIPTSDLPLGEMFAFIRAENPLGTGDWSPAAIFAVGARPNTPTWIGPTGLGNPVRPTFEWTASAGATGYELNIIRLSDGVVVINESGLTTTSFTPAVDLTSGAYSAYIRATNDLGNSDWAAANRFGVGARPEAPEILSPLGDGISIRPTFSWNAVPGAETYSVYVLRLDDGAVVLSQQGFAGTSLDAPLIFSWVFTACGFALITQWALATGAIQQRFECERF